MSRPLRAALGVCLSLLFVFLTLIPPTAAAGQTVTYLDGEPNRNVGANDYYRWASPVLSYLNVGPNGGYARVFARKLSTYSAYSAEDDVLVVEWYTREGRLTKTKTNPYLLPLFGGFFFGQNYNYALFGQGNPEESDAQTVFLLAQYDKEMNLLKTKPLKGENTWVPFDAGTCRFTEENGRLWVHTCHEMYGIDGVHHQANVTLKFDAASLELLDAFTSVGSGGWGYVSHSFNQFIGSDGAYVYRADHGDAYPRGIFLTKTDGNGSVSSVLTSATVLEFVGDTGANATGATLGGMALVEENVLIAGSIDDQTVAYTKSSWDDDRQKNVFVLSVAKSLDVSTVVRRDITKYANDSGVTVGNPHLVQLGSGALLLWEETVNGKTAVKALRVDKTGAPRGEIYTYDLRLSDCKPVVDTDGTVVWVVSDEERKMTGDGTFQVTADETSLMLCRIDPENPAVGATGDHGWMVTKVLTEPACEEPGQAEYVCVICGRTKTDVLPGPGHDWGDFDYEDIAWHTRVCRNDPSHVDRQKHTWTVEFSEEDPPTATQGGVGMISCDDCRVYYPRLPLPAFDVKGMFFNQDYHLRYQDETHSRMIAEEHEMGEWKVTLAPTCTEDGERTRECVGCPLFETEPMDASGHEWGAWTTTKAPTATQSGEESRVCANCGETQSRALPPTGGTFLLGDVDFDGVITAADARLALRRAVELETYAPGSPEYVACDVDKDSAVTAADARRILRASVELEDPATW